MSQDGEAGAGRPSPGTAVARAAAVAANGGSGGGGMQLDPASRPPPGPAARPGAPLSQELHQRAAELMIEGSAWMERHWQAARWAGLAVAAGSLAFMLRYGHVSGWRQYASLAELPPRLLAPEAAQWTRRLPVALHSVAQHGEAVAVRMAHYPWLRRLLDRYRGLSPAAAAERAANSRQLLTCYLAGPIQPTQEGLAYLRSLPRGSVHRLHLLSIVQAADQSWTGPHHMPLAAAGGAHAGADAAGQQRQQRRLEAGVGGGSNDGLSSGVLRAAGAVPTSAAPAGQPSGSSGSSSSSGGSSGSSGSSGSGNWAEQEGSLGAAAAPGRDHIALLAPRHQAPAGAQLAEQPADEMVLVVAQQPYPPGPQPEAAPAAAAAAPAAAAAAGAEAGASGGTMPPPPPPQQQEQLLLFGELYARERRRGLAALLPPLLRRRVDMGERLISRGQAAMMEPIDLEWLGVEWDRIDRLYAAEQEAIKQGLGIWEQRLPSLTEWGASLARSTWMRARHAARTSAAAAAGGLGSAAAAAGGAVAQATSAATDSLSQAAAAAAAAASMRRHGGGESRARDGAGSGAAAALGGWWARALAAAGRAVPWRRAQRFVGAEGKRRTGPPP